ncbi:protein shortage in chiasmata 1 ortholog [Nematostella vectensis]|uniref:protein shortage in chiasmata 1 ortholog n=1 Tax=Nematostella vectensis TaxID=45351 RepID=UPI002076FD6D|nr:protein shortage in chiasmata 1 ortholog [Nematostella vectensis]
MPKYLAINYLSQASEQRQLNLARMLLTVPHHMECMDLYPHKGKIEDGSCFTPWTKVIAERVSYSKAELESITAGIRSLECFSTAVSHPSEDEMVPSSNPDSPIVDFDLWSELEEEVLNYVVETVEPTQEMFFMDSAEDDDLYSIEDQISVGVTVDLIVQVPLLRDLASRLKPRAVPDPFTNHDGSQLTEDFILRGERTLSGSKYTAKQDNESKETFLKDYGSPKDEIPQMLEDPMIESPYEEMITGRKTLPDHLGHKEDVAMSDGSSLITTPCKPIDNLEYAVSSLSSKVDFMDINGEGVPSPEGFDLGGVLESPLATTIRDSTTQSNTSTATNELDPVTVSPVLTHQVMTPTSKERSVRKVWEKEKVFNEIVAMALPVPNVPSSTKVAAQDVSGLIGTMDKEVINTGVELRLCWDPLDEEAGPIEKARMKVARLAKMRVSKKQSKGSPTVQLPEAFNHVELREYQEKGDNPARCADFVPKSPSALRTTPLPERKQLQAVVYPTQHDTDHSLGVKPHENKSQNDAPATLMSNSAVKKNAIFSSLDDFLVLRTTKTPQASVRSTYEKDNSNTILNTLPIKQEQKKEPIPTSHPTKRPDVPLKDTKVVAKQERNASHITQSPRVIDLKLQEELLEAVEFLQSSIHPFLARLKQSGIIKPATTLSTLTPDYTRFLVKQTEVSMKEDENLEQCHRMVLCLHGLVGALDLVVNCGLAVAVAYLNNFQEKHGSVLKGTLESIRRHLVSAQLAFYEHGVLHPKMACVLELIGNWIMCKPSRILIVTTRFTELIHSSIAMIISSFGNIPVMLLTSSALDGFVETKGVEVYVASQLSIQGDFPWGLFSYVIEYEGESMIKSKVTSKLLDHVLLRTQGSIKEENAEHDAGPCDGCSEDPYVLIGSTRVTLDGELLHFLESRYNILIYERDYSKMRSCSSLSLDKMMLQPDLMIDERTCVVLRPVFGLASSDGYEDLKDLMLSLFLKTQQCYVILYYQTSRNG